MPDKKLKSYPVHVWNGDNWEYFYCRAINKKEAKKIVRQPYAELAAWLLARGVIRKEK